MKLNFSEALQDTQVLTNGLFTVEYSTDGGTNWSTQAHTVNGNSSDFTNGGSTIALTLGSAIADEAQVRVSYAASGTAGADVKDASDAMVALADFSNTAVINGTADSTAPTLTSATVDGTAVKLNFSEALQDTQVLTNGLFTVEYSTDGGTNWSTQAHTVNGNSSDFTNGGSTIALTLGSAIADEAQVRVSYAASGTAGADVKDASDAMVALADFSNTAVINGTADSTAPTLTSATVVGTAVKLNFSEALQDTQVLTNGLFTVEYSTDGGTNWSTQAHTVNGNSSDFTNGGSTIALTLGSAIADEAQVRVSYTASGTAGADVKDASDAMVALANFSNTAVINGTADSTAPTLTSATVDGTAVKLNFSEALQDTQVLTNGLFTVEYSTDGGTNWSTQAHTVNGNSSDFTNGGSTIALTLGSAIADEAQVRVSYAASGTAGADVKDASDAMVALADFSNTAVINGTADSTAPTLTSATVDGTAVKLNFSEALQDTQVLTNGLFTVEYSTDGGTNWSTQAHTVNGNSSDFHEWWINDCIDAGSAIADEAQVRVSYAASGTAGADVKDASDAMVALADFSNTAVINGTADSTAPTLTSATVDGTAVKLNFSEALQDTQVLTNGLFTVEYSTDGGTNWSTQAHTVNGNSSDFTNGGSTIALTLGSAIADEAQVRVSYAASGTAGADVKDASDAMVALADFSNTAVINGTADSTAPTLTSATVVGTAVKLNFSEALQDTQVLTNGLFTVEYSTDGGSNWTTQAHTVNGNSSDFTNGGSTIALTLGSAIADEAQVRVSYAASGTAGADVKDASDAMVALADFSNTAVINGTADSTAPTLTSATVDGTAVKLNFSEALQGIRRC